MRRRLLDTRRWRLDRGRCAAFQPSTSARRKPRSRQWPSHWAAHGAGEHKESTRPEQRELQQSPSTTLSTLTLVDRLQPQLVPQLARQPSSQSAIRKTHRPRSLQSCAICYFLLIVYCSLIIHLLFFVV